MRSYETFESPAFTADCPRIAIAGVMRTIFAFALVAGLAAPAAAGAPIGPADIEGPYTWGSASNVTHVRHLWFSGQPDKQGFEVAKTNGVRVVINLREHSELDFDEQAIVESLGLTYYNVPIPTAGPFPPQALDRIEELVRTHADGQILLHCLSSNRVGGWLATHFVRKHGMSVDDALAIGKKTGITKDAIVSKVRSAVAAKP